MLYEWDPSKAAGNLRKHKVSFTDAASVFLDPLALTFADINSLNVEEREITIGFSLRQGVLFVAHCGRGDRIRIISARKATRKERFQYEKNIREERQR